MSEINFNITDNTYPYDCLYHDTYGYRACLNGRRFDIAKIETVLALRNFRCDSPRKLVAAQGRTVFQ